MRKVVFFSSTIKVEGSPRSQSAYNSKLITEFNTGSQIRFSKYRSDERKDG